MQTMAGRAFASWVDEQFYRVMSKGVTEETLTRAHEIEGEAIAMGRAAALSEMREAVMAVKGDADWMTLHRNRVLAVLDGLR